MKLITIKDYLLLIDEEAEILLSGYAYQINFEKTNPQIIKIETDFQSKIANDKKGSYTKHKITAYYPLTKKAKELDLPLLPPFEKEIDIETIADEFVLDYGQQENIKEDGLLATGFVYGYKAAQSKQFTLEDIKKAFNAGERNGIYLQGGSYDKSDECDFDEFIQSLSTQQLPKEFIPKYEEIEVDRFVPKMPINILKTIMNSKGKQELVGTYTY